MLFGEIWRNCASGKFWCSFPELICHNPIRILALLAILFDLVFIVQHYVLYRHSAVGEVRSSRSELEAANDDTGVTESSPLLHD